jgi:GT2 family glycosyltransferase
MIKVMQKVYVVIPNWNGADRIAACLDSLSAQTQPHQTVVVDNGSIDNSVDTVEQKYPHVELIKHSKNRGFTGGVNPGIKLAIDNKAVFVALLNNDAVASKNWLRDLVRCLDSNPKAGIATSKICDANKTHLDSTGDIYTIWGLPYPRGREEKYSTKYDNDIRIFGGSGGASLYRVSMLKQIGLFDQDFFAYYEDIDISFRAQLSDWKVAYVPSAEVYHEISATSSKIPGFATYHTLKNLPMLLWKNVPWQLMPQILPRFTLLYFSIVASALSRGQFIPVIKGVGMSILLWPKKLIQRHQVQSNREVDISYISSIILHDLPPNAKKLQRLRNTYLRLVGKELV